MCIKSGAFPLFIHKNTTRAIEYFIITLYWFADWIMTRRGEENPRWVFPSGDLVLGLGEQFGHAQFRRISPRNRGVVWAGYGWVGSRKHIRRSDLYPVGCTGPVAGGISPPASGDGGCGPHRSPETWMVGWRIRWWRVRRGRTMSKDELSRADFEQNDLPVRPVRFRSDYRRNVNQFILVMVAVGVLIAGLVVLTML